MIRGVVIPKHEHEKFLALSNPSDILDLSRTHSVFWGLAAKTRLITHSNAPVMAAVTFRCSCLGIVKHCYPATLFPRSGAAGFRFARRRLLTVIASPYLSACLRCVDAEFLEARIIPERIEHRIEPEQRRSKRHVQDRARHAYGIESSFCKAAMARSGSPICAATRARISIAPGTSRARLSRSGSRPSPFRRRANAAALSPRPILVSARSPIRLVIFRLFFEKRFQFAPRLSPTFLGGGVLAGHFLRPA